MKIGCVEGRAVLVRSERTDLGPDDEVEVAFLDRASNGRFTRPEEVYADFAGFLGEAPSYAGAERVSVRMDRFEAPVPRPGQVFGVGLNYYDHLAEISFPEERPLPMTFTKFPGSITGPFSEIEIPTDSVDYEVELVVVLGKDADRVSADAALGHVAGLTVGQDLSARGMQQGRQLSLGKSFRGFAPIGPWVVTLDEIDSLADLGLVCNLNGTTMQQGSTAQMVHDVAELIAFLSSALPLRAGDLIFSGTCAGVGFFREPRVFLSPGDVLESAIVGVGRMVNRCVAPAGGGSYDEAMAALKAGPSQMSGNRQAGRN